MFSMCFLFITAWDLLISLYILFFFVYTYLDNILLRDNVMADKDNAWGPAHEIGHIHQKAINWPGCTEFQ